MEKSCRLYAINKYSQALPSGIIDKLDEMCGILINNMYCMVYCMFPCCENVFEYVCNHYKLCIIKEQIRVLILNQPRICFLLFLANISIDKNVQKLFL